MRPVDAMYTPTRGATLNENTSEDTSARGPRLRLGPVGMSWYHISRKGGTKEHTNSKQSEMHSMSTVLTY